MEKDEFVTRKQALALKELGFDEHCLATWEKDIKYPQRWDWDFELRNSTNQEDEVECTAPLKQQVFRWFREKYELYYRISGVKQSQYHYSIDYQYKDGKWGMMAGDVTTYEEAENACIDKLIEIANSQKDIDVPLSKQQSND